MNERFGPGYQAFADARPHSTSKKERVENPSVRAPAKKSV